MFVTFRNSGSMFQKFPIYGEKNRSGNRSGIPDFRNLFHNGNGKNFHYGKFPHVNRNPEFRWKPQLSPFSFRSLNRFRPPASIGFTKMKTYHLNQLYVIISYFVGSDTEDNEDEVNTPRTSRRLPGKSSFSDCKRNFKW